MIDIKDLDIHLKARDFFYTLLMNSVIAAFLTAVDFGNGFLVNLVFSQSIGISIYVSIYAVLAFSKTVRFLPRLVMIMLAMVVGALSGMTIAAFSLRNPAFLLNGQFRIVQTILFGLLFGSIISYIFISREKISAGNALLMEEKFKRLALEKKAVETEFQFLQSQIEPHFLFNTLSNVMSLIDTSPGRAKTMLGDFVSFLRSSLSLRRDSTITISQEMDLISNYLNILRVRMGDRLKVDISVHEDVREHPIPPLLIQPLVENAVKHGLEPKPEGGAIAVICESRSGKVRIEVSDSGRGIGDSVGGTGIGLANIEKRLNLLYGSKGRLTLHERKPSGVTAVIEIPYETN